MNGNSWIPHPQQHYSQPYQPLETPVAVDSVHDAHRLLGSYPFASATPSTHVSRHLNNLSLTATPPSYYVQPTIYTPQYTSSSPAYPSHYNEYSRELAHLSSSSMPYNDGGYWEAARSQSVRYIGEQASIYSQNFTSWDNRYPGVPSFQTSPFAQSIFQHTAPSTVYPTPPPGISSSSSSLANALGEPPQRPAPRAYRPQDSARFFNDFLAQQTTEQMPTPVAKEQQDLKPLIPSKLATDSSPNTRALVPTTPHTSRKRKAAQVLDSPSVKRVQTPQQASMLARSQSSVESRSTPSTSRGTPTPRNKLQAYVEVPPIPKVYQTPSQKIENWSSPTPTHRNKGKMRAHNDDDLGGFGSEVDDPHTMSMKSSGRRATGERDDRAPLEKLIALLEDITEAEDSLSPDADLSELSSEFFSSLTFEASRPLLHANIIRKLCAHITKVARPSKRTRQNTRDSGSRSPIKSRGTMLDVDTNLLSRILRTLERTVKAGEDIDPFGSSRSSSLGANKISEVGSPKKSPKKKHARTDDRRSKSKTPRPMEDDNEHREESTPGPEVPTDADLDALTRSLELAKESIYAADCCIALLSSDKLTKQLYSEELITTCLSTVKNQLMKIIYPFVEASSDVYSQVPPLLRYTVQSLACDCSAQRRQLAETFHAISSAIPRINDLICSESLAMPEGIIIQAVYVAIGPFFVVESGIDGKGKEKKDSVVLSTLGSSAMRGLRLDALSLIRSIFANHEDQRSWIIEEILSSLIKLSDSKQKAGQFRLRDGRSIRTVSALLLQLVQTSAHDIRIEARAIRKSRQQALVLQRQESFDERSQEPFLDEKDMEELRLYSSGLDSAMKAARTIVAFLTQRSGKTKSTKNSNEAEYRTIFDNLIADLLTVLFWPEWPASSLLLSIAIKYMVSSLDDIKSNTSENNAAKTIALDHLGIIASRLRNSSLRSINLGNQHGSRLKPMDEVSSALDVQGLELLMAAHQDLSSYLCKRAADDQAYNSARELTAVVWGQELSSVLKNCAKLLEDGVTAEATVRPFGTKLKSALQDVWKDSSADIFDSSNLQEESLRIDRLAEEIGTVQTLKVYFNPILNVVLQALDAPPVFMRTKALKALGQILTSDPTILGTENVRRSIESHLLDSSPAVRDAAVELIGKYMIESPELASNYYQKIAERVADTGLGVRKRVIRLLKSFYIITEDRERRIDICVRMVLRMLDEDDTIKDLAIRTMEELWFLESAGPDIAQKPFSSSTDKTNLLNKVTVIMGVSSNFRDRHSPLEELLHKIISEKDGANATSLHRRYAEICETLIDGLVDASDIPGFTVVNCVRTIYLFSAAYPAVLSTSNVCTLLPYLKNATTPEEQIASDYLLRIFKASIPHLPKTALKFGQELQLALQPMIVKPSTTAGVVGLQETVACMCTVVRHITHDFKRLVSLLKSCSGRLQQTLAKPISAKTHATDMRTLSILILIAALLCEHCDFEQLKTQDDICTELASVTQGSVTEHMYHTFLRLYEKYPDSHLRSRILQCLGFLFRTQPTLLTAETSSHIMDDIFASEDEEARGRLLKIMQEFLVSEAEKHAAKEKVPSKAKLPADNVNMDELVGNTDGFADSGVSSAVVQRYLDYILVAALSQTPQVQGSAVDILSFTIKQGLAHPLQCFPVIVALETSINPTLSGRANGLHAILHGKHTSLLNARYVASARASFDYQKKSLKGPIQGYRMLPGPTALLHRWYSLVREKRATRQDFLKSLVKVFDVEMNKSTQDDVDFGRYMAENFATFDYKTQEEVLTVLKYLTSVLSTVGMHLVEMLSPSHLLKQLHDDAANQYHCPVTPHSLSGCPPEQDFQTHVPIARSSVIVGIIMLLKTYLKSLYGISEDKCSKWVLGKKSAIGDRPASRRHEKPLIWERLSFATHPILTSEDCQSQRQRFLEVWSEDGVTAEPEDDFI